MLTKSPKVWVRQFGSCEILQRSKILECISNAYLELYWVLGKRLVRHGYRVLLDPGYERLHVILVF